MESKYSINDKSSAHSLLPLTVSQIIRTSPKQSRLVAGLKDSLENRGGHIPDLEGAFDNALPASLYECAQK